MKAPVVLFCNNNQWAISTPSRADRAPTLATRRRVRHAGRAVDGCDVLAVYEATREAVLRARAGDGPTLHRGGHVPRRAARHRGRSVVYVDSSGRGGRSTSASGGTSATCCGSASSTTSAPRRSGGGARADARGIAAAEAEPPADPSLVFEHAYAIPPSLLADTGELRRILGG
jgi:pyruvate dehydrogenase E1 component alpha subunit